MCDPFRFVLAAVATWRVSALLVREDGPFDGLTALRAWAERRRWRVLDCFYCTSLWMAVPATLSTVGLTAAFPIVWFAIGGAAALLERVTGASQTTTGEQPLELAEAANILGETRR